MSAAAVMRRSNRRSARGTSSVACFTGVLAGLVVLRAGICEQFPAWGVASVLLNASCKVKDLVKAFFCRGNLSLACAHGLRGPA